MTAPAPAAPRLDPTPENIATLRALLGDPIPPGGTDADAMFSDAELAAILAVSSSMAQAACLGWQRKGLMLADPNRLVRGQIGSESLEFQRLGDIINFAKAQADWWCQQVEGGPAVALMRSVAPPVFFGIEGPYNETHGYYPQFGPAWGGWGWGRRAIGRGAWLDDDASRMGGTQGARGYGRSGHGLHGVTGGGHN